MADDKQDKKQDDAPVEKEETIVEAPPAESAEEAAEVLEQTPAEELKAETPKEEASPEPETKKKSKPVTASLEKIIEQIEKLSVLELADLVHALEDRFGVTAAPMVIGGQAAGAAPAGATEEGASEQTTFNVILASAGANKIGAIKAVRELVPTLGLKEAKDLVEAAPKPVMEGVNKQAAEEAKLKLTAAGASVELQ